MFEKVSYDQIYDEHIFIFSAISIKKIFERFDLHLVNVIPQQTHGGSMRYVIKRKKEVEKNLLNLINLEKEKNLDNIKSCLKFKNDC